MSQSHIPQPSAAGAAEVFESTSDNNPNPSISSIGGPGPSPGEVSQHTGASNTLDITINRQYYPTDSISWTTAQVKGTLLWFVAVHPGFANPIISYLMNIYNCWGGGFDWNFKVAGTGFHAGAVAIVRIPPNRHPSEFTTVSSWGAFEYLVIDPKTLEVVSAHSIDQRPINYHYLPYDASNPASFGGFLAMYVLIPLNTSSSGSQQIAIQVFNRPAPDFQFSQLIYPHLSHKTLDPVTIFDSIFNFKERSNHVCRSTLGASVLRVMPASLKVIDSGTDGARKLNGDYLLNSGDVQSMHQNNPIFKCTIRHVPDKYTSIADYDGDLDKRKRTWYIFGPARYATLYSTPKNGVITPTNRIRWDVITNHIELPDEDVKENLDDCIYSPVNTETEVFQRTHKQTFATVVPESVIVFKSDNGLWSLQTHEFAVMASSGYFTSILPSRRSAAMFVIVDQNLDLPVGYAKLTQDGILSTNASHDAIDYHLDDIKFIYDSNILESDPLPKKPEFTRNMLLVSQHHSSVLAKRKWQAQQLEQPQSAQAETS
uniref:Calicivirus coat protein domain-containing protein n=1 Tax=Riboviria sp. TaxID=2585031 RepID=A0A6M3YNS1_9VIRU|nr:MAG: hypothetical protein 2 [Riboviria sp.]